MSREWPQRQIRDAKNLKPDCQAFTVATRFETFNKQLLSTTVTMVLLDYAGTCNRQPVCRYTQG